MMHRKETSFLKPAFSKAAVWFHYFREMLRMENFCLKVGFNERQTDMLTNSKPIFYEGELYSEGHKRKFKTKKAGFPIVSPRNLLNLNSQKKLVMLFIFSIFEYHQDERL